VGRGASSPGPSVAAGGGGSGAAIVIAGFAAAFGPSSLVPIAIAAALSETTQNATATPATRAAIDGFAIGITIEPV